MSRDRIAACSEEIEKRVDNIRRLIDSAAKIDPELAAGLGCSEELTSVHRKLDAARAAAEELHREYRDLLRTRIH